MATVDGNTITMGPTGDQWYYDRPTRTYDLSRSTGETKTKKKTLTVKTAGDGTDASIALAPDRTALVIVDMQNYFIHPRCLDHPTGLAAVTPLAKVIDDCRSAGIQIIWVNWGLTDNDLATMPSAVVRGFSKTMMDPQRDPSDNNIPRRGLGVDLGHGQGRALVAGEWNSAVYAGLPIDAAHDVQVPKNRISGMWSTETPLWKALAARPQLRTLLFAGVNTDQCVLGTLVDAYNGGWDCVAVADCCATTTPTGQETSLWNVSHVYGFVINSETFGESVEAYQKAEDHE